MQRRLTIFDLLFETLPDGKITPRVQIRIEGREFGRGALFEAGYHPNGFPLEEWRGRKIFGHYEGNVVVIDAVEH